MLQVPNCNEALIKPIIFGIIHSFVYYQIGLTHIISYHYNIHNPLHWLLYLSLRPVIYLLWCYWVPVNNLWFG